MLASRGTWMPGMAVPDDLWADASYTNRVRELQAKRDKIDRLMEEHTLCPIAELDDTLVGLAKRSKDLGLTKDQRRSFLRKAIFKAYAQHEVGHNLGLRHNFADSYDSLNYFKYFWDVETAGLSNQEHILQTDGAKLARFLEVGASMLIDVNDELDEIKPPHYLWRSDEIPKLTGPLRISQFATQECADLLRSGKTVVVCDSENDRRVDAIAHRAANVRSSLNVPFTRNGIWKYLIVAVDSRPRNWREDEVDLFRDFANRVSLRIERARADAATRESEERYRSGLEKEVTERAKEVEKSKENEHDSSSVTIHLQHVRK